MMENKGVKKESGCWESEACPFLLEQQRCHAAHFALLLYKDFKVLVDDGHGQEDSGTRTNRTQEVSHHGQPSYTEATEGSGCGDVPAKRGSMNAWCVIRKMEASILYSINVNLTLPDLVLPVKLVHHRRLPVAPHDHLLLLQLLRYLRYRENRATLTECKAGVLNENRSTNSRLWRKIPTLRSMSWRKRHTSPA